MNANHLTNDPAVKKPMLLVDNLSVTYDGTIKAVKNVSMSVNQGEIVVFIGANGAGKTSTLRAITGLVKTSAESRVEYTTDQEKKVPLLNDDGTETLAKATVPVTFELTKMRAYKMVSLGISHVPEGRQIFANLTVRENLKMGAYTQLDHDANVERRHEMYRLFPRLMERKHQKAGTLSGGEQQMLAMARALMSRPRLLLLDEPSMGLSPILVQEIFDIIKEVNKEGVTVLLVEQNAKMALAIADRGYVLETGRVVLSGTGAELLENEAVKTAYLGA